MVVNQRLQALAYGAMLAVLAVWVLYVGKDVFVPVAFGVVVVYIVSGLAHLLSRISFLASVLTTRVRYVLSVLVIAAALAIIASLVIGSIGRFVENSAQYQASVMGLIQKIGNRFGIETEPTWTSLREYVLQRIRVSELLGSTAALILSIASSVVLVFLYAAFLLVEQSVFSDKIDRLSNDPVGASRIRRIISSINARIGRYLALKTVLGIAVGVLSLIVMKILGIEFAAFLALLIALLNYIPYIGSVLSVIFPVAVAIVQFGDLNVALVALLLLSVVQFVNGNLLDPYLMGNSLNLSPFFIVLSLAVWSALWGIPGALLAVPFAAILLIVFSESEATRPIAILLSRDGRLSTAED
jgi:AI-2 transport protein TqsA